MTDLFSPLEIRGVTLRNRIALSPMCQYSAIDGIANDWHLVNLGTRAVGGVGLLIAEATAVEARGRITPGCLGIWSDRHAEALKRVCAFVSARGAVPAIQLAHAGVKASRHRPLHATPNAYVPPEEGGWMPVGPTAQRFNDDGPVPHELSIAEIHGIRDAFAAAAERAVAAGFRVIELHFAHGYLGHSFLSPFMNKRRDAYGGPFDHRVSFLLDTVKMVREAIPQETPLLVRLSCTDWKEGGWTLDDSVETSRLLKRAGVDLIDCSSGGAVRRAGISVGPGYQVPFAERIRREADIATGAVGLITEPAQADAIVRNGRADLVLLGRQLLREPYWPLRAWDELNADGPAPIAPEYAWALAETRRSS
jgi:2,4-dienoyl-CoA reductase-like NADH-dependent reductase (Old Yellow Enzyme family)